MEAILSRYSASISELKKSPTKLLEESQNTPVAILNHNTPSAYLVPSAVYASMLAKLEDYELLKIALERKSDNQAPISVTLDEL